MTSNDLDGVLSRAQGLAAELQADIGKARDREMHMLLSMRANRAVELVNDITRLKESHDGNNDPA